eukprot:1392243-Amorphochlora_amoeboformis.AAC.2
MENRDGGGQVAVAVLKDFVGLLASSSSSSSYNSSHYDHHCEHGHSIFEVSTRAESFRKERGGLIFIAATL